MLKMKKFLSLLSVCIFAYVYCALSPAAYGQSKMLTTVLQSSPNIDAMEFILILNNDLEKSILLLDRYEKEVRNNDETEIERKIRLTHLSYLRAYAYSYHVLSQNPKKKHAEEAFEAVKTAITLGTEIIKEQPDYSDIYRVVAVSMMLNAEHGLLGVSRFLTYQHDAIEYAKKAVTLDPGNPMARVVLNNFDTLANFLVGANKKRGRKAIMVPIQKNWKKAQIFEFLYSQCLLYRYEKNSKKLQLTLSKMKSLYPESWRYTEFRK